MEIHTKILQKIWSGYKVKNVIKDFFGQALCLTEDFFQQFHKLNKQQFDK